jgi:hypothetical protein
MASVTTFRSLAAHVTTLTLGDMNDISRTRRLRTLEKKLTRLGKGLSLKATKPAVAANVTSAGTGSGSLSAITSSGCVCGPTQEVHMILLGVVLMIVGFVASIPIFWTIGIVLLIIGIVLELMGTAGHAVAGRRHYY